MLLGPFFSAELRRSHLFIFIDVGMSPISPYGDVNIISMASIFIGRQASAQRSHVVCRIFIHFNV